MDRFAVRLTDFTQRIADKFFDGRYKVTVTDTTQPVPSNATKATTPQPTLPNQPAVVTKVGDRSEPTAHGIFYEFCKRPFPYAVKQVGAEQTLGVLCECKTKADAEAKVAEYEREAATGAI